MLLTKIQILSTFILFATVVECSNSEDFDNSLDEDTGCTCVGYNCGCCADLDVPEIGLDDTACVNVTYLPSPDYGISVLFSLDGKIYYNYTVSVRNPPPMCFGIPFLTKFASLCLKFYDISFTNTSLSACIQLEAKLEGLIVDKFKLGCFKIPPTSKDETLRFLPRKQQVYSDDFGKVINRMLEKLELENELKD